ncbi:phenylacetate--CoA ligase family protein [Haloechinothrix sp. YIM 98757]|uniref:Phenylacetate--CoA ligase family protein n=1 Tax=Haloechinothrix aidingensis TaxID=2752311 RepID=A0A838AAH9_9PSEU|nr:phenylacetate--CoA ligase family protein [Haloechinothrix aidingensis]MBA0126243.1 phenylacetate--CoA ligase family protein [Haloechinothrix aidingensis]
MSALDERVGEVVRRAAARIPAFAARLHAAGVPAERVRRVSDLDELAVLTKDDLIALQRSEPPLGGMLDPDTEVCRLFSSPGPLYEPQLAGADPWRWQEALQAAGFGRGDVVLNCFGYHLSPAGAMFDEAARALGCTVVPGGTGSLDLQVQAIADLGVTAFTGLPSYLKSLIERYHEAGHDARGWRLSKALVTAEPLPDSLRALLTEHVPVVRAAYGTAETGLLGYEIEPGAGLRVPDGVVVDVCDLDTDLPIDSGEGQVVITLLRPEYPLVRFGTGDLSAWITGPDGSARLAGVLGRVGAAVKVRGMFLHPRQVDSAMRDLAGVAGYRFVVERAAHRDELRCEIVPSAGVAGEQVAEAARERIKSALRFNTRVDIVDDLNGTDTLVDQRDWAE